GVRVERSLREIADAGPRLEAGTNAQPLTAREERRAGGGVVLVVATHLDLVVLDVGRKRRAIGLTLRVVVDRRAEDVSESAGRLEGDAIRVERVIADLRHVDSGGLGGVPVPVLGVLEREDAKGSEELVQPSAVVRSARVAAAAVLERRGARRNRREQDTLLRLRVGEDAADDRGALEPVQRHLARVLVLEIADRVLVAEGGLVRLVEHLEGLVDLDAVIRAEEPDLVLHGETAEIGAEFLTDVLREHAVLELRVTDLGEDRRIIVVDVA